MPNIKPLTNESDIVPDVSSKAPTTEQPAQTANIKPNFVNDVQLPPMGQRSKSQIAIDLPDQVGFISRFPVRAYVIAWAYLFLLPFYAYSTYIAVLAEQARALADKDDVNLITRSVMEPGIAIVVASFMILAMLGGSKIAKWLGFLIGFASFTYQIISLMSAFKTLSASLKPDMNIPDTMNAYLSAIMTTNLWALMAGALILGVTIIYLISPRFKVAYR